MKNKEIKTECCEKCYSTAIGGTNDICINIDCSCHQPKTEKCPKCQLVKKEEEFRKILNSGRKMYELGKQEAYKEILDNLPLNNLTLTSFDEKQYLLLKNIREFIKSKLK